MKVYLTPNPDPPYNLMLFYPAYGSRAHSPELTNNQFLGVAITRDIEVGNIGPESPVYIVEDSDLPADLYFQNAWEHDGAGGVRVNRAKAEVIQMDHIRRARAPELERESGSKYQPPDEVEAIFTVERKARLKALRDIPQVFDFATYPTPETLKDAWPPELPPRA